MVLTKAHHARQGGGASSSLYQHWRHRHAIVLHDKPVVPMACVVVVVPDTDFIRRHAADFTMILCRLLTEVERDLDAMSH